MGLSEFEALIKRYLFDMVSTSEIEQAYEKILAVNGKKGTNQHLTFKEFDEVFSHIIPRVGSKQFETMTIKKVREWMFSKQYCTKTAFERLCRSTDRFTQMSLTRYDFHRAVVINRIPLSTPEIDFLFDMLTGNTNGELNFEAWSFKIYDDIVNPLQALREVIQANKLDIDDCLYQMKLKIWDDPLDYKKFSNCLHHLDPTFSDSQCKALFNKLKNGDRVEVQTLLNNICGTVQDTVDYKNKVYRILYD